MTHTIEPIKDTLNVWHDGAHYHVRYAGKHYTFKDYLSAKCLVDSITQSIYFTGFGTANDNAKAGA